MRLFFRFKANSNSKIVLLIIEHFLNKNSLQLYAVREKYSRIVFRCDSSEMS
jgi:hypothetical protein